MNVWYRRFIMMYLPYTSNKKQSKQVYIQYFSSSNK